MDDDLYDDDSAEFGRRVAEIGEISSIVVEVASAQVRAGMHGTRLEPVRRGDLEIYGPPLGAGGMGIVFPAYDRERGEEVAVKTLHSRDPDRADHLKREFRALADLVHPNLVELHHLQAGDETFFSMERVRGKEIVAHLSDASTTQIAAAFRQLASGLQALHGADKLHLDVKPSNVLVTAEGRVVLLDFGLVHELRSPAALDSSVCTGAGTPFYMSPEQVTGEEVSPASDWYAFGLLLYRVLTGQTPFAELEQAALLRAKRDREPPAPSKIRPEVAVELDALCIELLRRRPTDRPDGAEVLRRLGADMSATSVPPPTASGTFVGRTTELAALDRAFDDVTTSARPVLVRVSGDPGLGKTTLVHRFLEHVRASRPTQVVLFGRCYPQESVSYPGIDSLVDALVRRLLRLPPLKVVAILPRDIHALAQLFPTLLRVGAIADAPHPAQPIRDAHEARRRAFSALKELLARLADHSGPLIAFIDDLQWGDADTAHLLRELTTPPDPPQLLLIVNHRSEDDVAAPLFAELEARLPNDTLDLRSLSLAPLSTAESTHLACELLGGGSTEFARKIAQESEGNPLLLGEFVRHAETSRDFPETRELDLADVLGARIAELSDNARGVLEVVAIAGMPIDVASACDAAAAMTADEHRTIQPFDSVVGVGWSSDRASSSAEYRRMVSLLAHRRMIRVRKAGDREQLECFHDRIRETVVARLDPPTFRGLHRSVAEALEMRRTAEPATLAMHFRAAGQPQRALRHALSSAAQAEETLAFDRAAALYRLALDLGELTPERRRELQTRLGDALSNAGRGPEAAEAYLGALQGAGPHDALELRRRASDRYLRSGHIERGRELLQEVLASFGMRAPSSPARALAAYVFEDARLRLRGLEPHDSVTSDPRAMARIDVCWASAIGLVLVDPVASWTFVPMHLRLALDAGEPARIACGLSLYAWLHASTQPASPRVRALLRSANGFAENAADAYTSAFVRLVEAHVAMYRGEWATSLRQAEEAASTLRDRCTGASWEINAAQITACTALVWSGELREGSRRMLHELRSARERGDLYAEVMRRGNRITSYAWLIDDDPTTAMREVQAAKELWSDQSLHFQQQLLTQAEAMILLYSDPERAWETVRQAWTLRRPARQRSVFLRIWAWSLRGACAAAAARNPRLRDVALADATKAARALASEHLPFAVPLATGLRAAVAARRGDRTTATTELELSSEQFDALGMRLAAACARREMGRLKGAAGHRLLAEADTLMAEQGVRNPERMYALLMPGFD